MSKLLPDPAIGGIRFMLRASLPLLLVALSHSSPVSPAEPQTAQRLQELAEVVVIGRQPGPPLWKVSRDGHALWILPLVDMYPKKMKWDSARVEQLIAGSQGYIARPMYKVNLSASPMLIFRAIGLYGKMTNLPSGRTLGNVMPRDLYARFSGLRSRYFAGNRTILKRRPSAAAIDMKEAILKHENLQELEYDRSDSPALIMDPIGKWLKKNKTIAYFENDLGPVKRRANAWAQGHADDLVSPAPVYDFDNSCDDPEIDKATMERLGKEHPALVAFINMDEAALAKASRELWLKVAEGALANNVTTFSVLAVDDVIGPDSLVSRLEARGYKVEVSAE